MPFLILVIIICMIVALFAVQNAVAVSLNFVFWSFSASLVLVILGAFLMGVLVATCFLLTMKAKHYLKDKKMREEMQQLQAENKRLQEPHPAVAQRGGTGRCCQAGRAGCSRQDCWRER